jgi:hypothetical protein
MNPIIASIPALALCLLGPAVAQVSPNGPAISPFRGMRAVESGLEVQIHDDTWYALESVHGVDTATLLRESRRLCGGAWWKRVTEDLPALLDAMGHPAGREVDLQLRDLGNGELVELAAVPMTGENRRRLWQANGRGAAPAPDVAQPAEELAAGDALADLDELRSLLDSRYSYRELRKLDLDALFRAARGRLGDGAAGRDALAREVDAILRACGDGHSRLADGQLPASACWLPFLVQRVAGGHVAFWPDRSELLDAERPFVAAIDGHALERWLAAARARATQGSATMVERDAERLLRELGTLRADLGLRAGKRVAVRLRGAGAERELLLEVAAVKPVYGAWPRTESRLLDGNVGYLRLPSMRSEPEFLDGIDAAMQSFRGARALVVDVRGNGGGSRDALRRLFPYFLGPDDPPVVANVAAVLLSTCGRADPASLLADRGLHLADWQGWTDAQRAAITQFARGFAPEWQPPKGRFSPWHFLVLGRTDNPAAFHYTGPVLLLIDAGCFSATDVFVAALRTRPQVKLVGTATSGGSGRARPYRLPRSGIALQLSSMASFRPDGRLFDGNGIEPDVRCEPAPADLVSTSDAVLEAALKLAK